MMISIYNIVFYDHLQYSFFSAYRIYPIVRRFLKKK